MIFKDCGFLKLSANAKFSDLGLTGHREVNGLAKEGGTRVSTGLTGDDIHHCGLTRAIGPDDAAQLSFVNGEVEFIKGAKTIELHRHVL